MKDITQSEALEALNKIGRDTESFSIVGEPDHLGPVSVFFVRVWDDQDVDWVDVMFYRKDGEVKVYEGRN